MSIKTEYRGYTISYSENSDEWSCYDCGVSHVSLSKVKAKIDALHLKLRKAAAVECLSIGGYDSGSSGARPATIIDYLGPRMERSGSFGTERRIADHRVAVFAKALGNDRPSRREADLSSLAFDTPEVQAQLAEWRRLHAEAERYTKLASEAMKAIPRLQLSDIEALIKASEQQIEEPAHDPH